MRSGTKSRASDAGEPCPYCAGQGRVQATCATRFVALRVKHDIRQEAFAKTCGLSRSALANIEAGRKQPSVDVLLRIVGAPLATPTFS